MGDPNGLALIHWPITCHFLRITSRLLGPKMAVRHGLGRYFGLRRHHTHFRLQMYQDYWWLKKSIFGWCLIWLYWCIVFKVWVAQTALRHWPAPIPSPSCIIESLFQSRKVVKHVSWFNHDEDGGGLKGYETNQLLWKMTFYDGQLLAVLPGVYNLLLFNPDGSINEAEAAENEFGLEALDFFRAFRALFWKIISFN